MAQVQNRKLNSFIRCVIEDCMTYEERSYTIHELHEFVKDALWEEHPGMYDYGKVSCLIHYMVVRGELIKIKRGEYSLGPEEAWQRAYA